MTGDYARYVVTTKREGLTVKATLTREGDGKEWSSWVLTHNEGARWARRQIAQLQPAPGRQDFAAVYVRGGK